MWAIINLDGMMFVYASENQRLLSSLAYIELCHVTTRVCDASHPETYRPFTVGQLMSLYRSVTGETGALPRAKLVELLAANAYRLPVVDANPYEAMVQANMIGDDDDGYYRYVKGASRAQVLDDSEAPTLVGLRWLANAPPRPAVAPPSVPQPWAATTPPAPAPVAQKPAPAPTAELKFKPPWL